MPWDKATREKHARKAGRSDLAEWEAVVPVFPAPAATGRPLETDLREILNAVQYRAATGCQPRCLPCCFSNVFTVRYHFYKWCREGIFPEILEALRHKVRELEGRDPTAGVIDSQSVKTTEADSISGAGKKVKGRKRHLTYSACRLQRMSTRRTFRVETAQWN